MERLSALPQGDGVFEKPQHTLEALDIEKQPEDVVKKVVEVNGGDDWVVPTMEYNGKWRPGQVFDAGKLEADLKAWGVI